MYLIPQEGARKGMWTQLVTVDREQGDARGWGLCSLRPRGHRIKKKKIRTNQMPSLPLKTKPRAGCSHRLNLGKPWVLYRWAKAMFSVAADHESLRMLSPTSRPLKNKGGV